MQGQLPEDHAIHIKGIGVQLTAGVQPLQLHPQLTQLGQLPAIRVAASVRHILKQINQSTTMQYSGLKEQCHKKMFNQHSTTT